MPYLEYSIFKCLAERPSCPRDCPSKIWNNQAKNQKTSAFRMSSEYIDELTRKKKNKFQRVNLISVAAVCLLPIPLSFFLLAIGDELCDVFPYVIWFIWSCITSPWLPFVINQHLFEIPVDVVVSNRGPPDVAQVIYKSVGSWTSGLKQSN